MLQIPRIVASFIKARNIPALVTSIQSPSGSQQFDAVAADGLLNELRQLLACVHEFMAFLHRTAATAVHPKPVPRDIAEVMADGDHSRSIKELQGAYATLEAAYVHSSISKALEWDKVLQVRTVMNHLIFHNCECPELLKYMSCKALLPST